MIVCICKTVSEDEILRAILEDTMDQLIKDTQVGMGCGTCVQEIRYLIEENSRDLSSEDLED
jgi:bacterioferritin-associated ferredoxin